MNVLLTPRLRLRPMVRTDLRFLQGLYGDADIMRYITGRPRTPWETRARLRKDLRDHESYGFGLCIAEWRASKVAVGRCGLEPRRGRSGLEGELAWMFARDWWGRGLATEAGRRLIRFGIEELGLGRVYAESDPENEASVHVMKKLGMTPVATSAPTCVYEVLRDRSAVGPAVL